MAIRAGDLASRDRVCRQVMHLRALCLVAFEAHFPLRFFRQRFVLRLMDLVARCAGDVISRMRASRPMPPFACAMAVEAGSALDFSRGFVYTTENEIGGRSVRRGVAMSDVSPAGTMTSLTTRLTGYAVACLVDCQNRFFFIDAMATRADGVTTGAFLEGAGCVCGVCNT